jgi:transcription elongation factor GreA
MSDNAVKTPEIVRSINELLNEEKWTRATINNYTIHNFQELEGIISRIFEQNFQEQVKAVCEEHLHHTKNSIIALYISGVIALSQQIVNDSHLIMLINIFSDNHKWNIVEFLCTRILEFGENKYALRTLSECYNNENETDKMYDTWERLIRVDYEEADIVKSLAEKKEQQNLTEEAVDYYKKALHRYINKKLFNNIREIWHKLVSYCPEETEFFYHAERKISKTVSEERAIQLLEDLYPFYKKNKNWEISIDILKRILEYDIKNGWARKEIIECFREKFKSHSQLEEYIRLSNLTQSWRNIHDAISDFEKHISFDAGNFVFHREWGVGQIKNIKDDIIEIDFVKKRHHKMSLKMAVSALQILGKQHIWVMKSAMNKDKLKKKIKDDIPWALKIIIRSLDNAADMKKIKAELVPSVLTPGEWAGWSTAARRVLKEDNNFGNLSDRVDYFEVRDQPVSLEEKILNKFKAEKDFFDRVQIIEDYAFNMKSVEPTAESFGEMLEYFLGFLRSSAGMVNEYVVASSLLIKKIVSKYPYLNPDISIDYKDIFGRIENFEEIFQKLDNTEIKKEFLIQIKKQLKNWPERYLALFPYALSRHILDELLAGNYLSQVQTFFSTVINGYKEYRECFVWLVRNFFNTEWYRKLDVKYEKILISLVHLLDISFREIDNRKDASSNRKLYKQIHTYLIEEKNVENYLQNADEDSITRIYTLIWDVKSIDDSFKLDLRAPIQKRFPDYKFLGKGDKEVVASYGFYVTAASYEWKQKTLQQILEVEIPANSKEIAEARALGDLKENAEYKAAKEKQELLNSTVGKLKEELERAHIIYRKDIDGTKINFGTKVSLLNKETDTDEVYVIMGPWESDPAKMIISYLSPLGNELMNHVQGEDLLFEINERQYNYKIKDISIADY